MLSNEELQEILKAQITTGLGGLASPQDAEEFIDLAVEQSAVLQAIRVETGIKTSMNLDALELGEPAMVAATEATAPAPDDVVAPTHIRKVLQPVEVIAAYDVSFSFLRKNIEGDRVNETLNRIFAKRWGKDTVQLIFTGDTALTGTTRTDKLKKILDGFVKQAEGDADVHDYTIPDTPTYSGKDGVFNSMLKLLPKDYRDQRAELSFFCSQNVVDAYLDELGERATSLGDTVLLQGEKMPYRGVVLRPVFGMPDNRIILTLNQNLAVGFGEQMTVGRDISNRERLLKVTITGQIDCKYVVGDAVVLGAGA
ncbi:hypothetical protein Calab_1459 [Caldithrix abyssi DSM 13497]|uniref:Phage capsid and scaffold n=1 Tax=Caldithrix abyssi DSM 13497 TaxID=880073 RepID=H1XPV4_CALAY|nr:hypothetical protein [Caldithrix abyssi]APF20392.1 Phage capsid and scaffold [Caldithrix abyssi DSM 13497]EHO41080.1 hypothetical protein Calab_1459 [Caldithrix abyssi DSM 13497]